MDFIDGSEIRIPKKQCISTDYHGGNIPSESSSSELSPLKKFRSLSEEQGQDVSRKFCRQKYIVPVVWHVIMGSQNKGDASDDTLRRQVDILNGEH